MRKPYMIFIMMIVFSSIICGCISSDSISAKGRVVFVDLEGGFYGILGENGEKYYPINLNQSFKVDGLHVKFEGRLCRNISTAYMWGKPVEITKIEIIE